jgi:hypothetical protein
MNRFLAMPRNFRVAAFYWALIALSALTLNLLTSPRYLWCAYPVLGALWWPLSAYFRGSRQPLLFALCGAGLVTATFFIAYRISSPGAHPWYVYPMLCVFWWPLSVWGHAAGARRFSVVAAQYIILMALTINMITSPGFWWWLFPAALVIWWPLILYFPKLRRKEGDDV